MSDELLWVIQKNFAGSMRVLAEHSDGSVAESD